jgi:hypothetical protein
VSVLTVGRGPAAPGRDLFALGPAGPGLQPVMFLMLFTYLFGGAIAYGTVRSRLKYVLPQLKPYPGVQAFGFTAMFPIVPASGPLSRSARCLDGCRDSRRRADDPARGSLPWPDGWRAG